MIKPELLAPVGGSDALIAAVQSGADAVYLGAGRFNARQSADNFDKTALADAVKYAHERHVRVHVTLNTLVREDEISDLIHSIEEIAEARPDAVLVQDFGVARLVREIVPELPLHASTQMAAHNRQAVEFLARECFARAVLAREMSLEEIRACSGLGIETEVFVHGALCVACSGQCLFSSLVGGRSGNRGRCAQPCRLPYQMDGRNGYLLSTRDLCAIDQLDQLAEAGVSSFKIEGRLKRPEYVSEVVRLYRSAIDHTERIDENAVERLKQMFNRGGFTEGYLPGVSDVNLIYAARPNHLGVAVGTCLQNGKIHADKDLEPEDMLVLRAPSGSAKSDCMDVLPNDRPIKLRGNAGETVRCPEAKKGDTLIRLVSESQMRGARDFCAKEHRVNELDAKLTLRVGEPLRLTVTESLNASGNPPTVTVSGSVVERAQTRGTDEKRVREQLSKTGGTAYVFRNLEIDMDADAFCPISALNTLRREALEKFAQITQPKPYTICAARPLHPIAHEMPKVPEILVESANPEVLVRARKQNVPVIYSPVDVRISALNAALNALPDTFFVALPMVLSERSLETLNGWGNDHADRIRGVYLSNIGQLNCSWCGEHRADFSLNAANREAVRQLQDWGIQRITPSVELTAAQIAKLDGETELIVHGYLPLMQLRHCPYRTTHLCLGKHASCRRCDTAADPVTGRMITDRTGTKFPLCRVATEDGCIVRILNSVPLMLLKRANRLPKADGWRIMTEDAETVEDLIRLYAMAAENRDFRQDPAWAKFESLPATTGHYFRGVE